MNIPLTILSLLYAVYVSYHAVRNRVPVSEWLTLVVIYIGLQVILVPGAPEHLTMALIIGAGLLCVSFFIRFARYAEEKEKLFADSKAAASLAEQAGVKLCLECHKKTYTETAEAALELLTVVNSPAFEMYWQPNQSRSQEENVANARALKNYVNHIHVFQWKEKERFSLEEGLEEWKAYLGEIPGDRCLLLEFMPNDTLEELPTQTAALRKLTEI